MCCAKSRVHARACPVNSQAFVPSKQGRCKALGRADIQPTQTTCSSSIPRQQKLWQYFLRSCDVAMMCGTQVVVLNIQLLSELR